MASTDSVTAKEASEAIGVIVQSVIQIAGMVALRGWIFMTLWRWFIITPFNVRELSFAESAGLLIFSASLMVMPRKPKEKSGADWGSFFSSAMAHLILLGIGYLVHLAT